VLREPGDGWRVQPVIEVAADGGVRAGAGWAEFARRWTGRDGPWDGPWDEPQDGPRDGPRAGPP